MKAKIKNSILLLAVVGFAAGCVSTGAKRTEKVNSASETTRQGLEKTKAIVTETLATLDSLRLESTVLADAYPAFQKQVKEVASGAERLKKNSIAMQKVAAVKFDAWKAKLQSIKNEKIRKISTKEMNEAMAKHEALLNLIKESGTVMDPFVSDLDDIVKYLDLNLSKESIKKISGFNGSIKKATKDGDKVQKWIGKAVGALAKSESKPAVQ